MNDVQNLVSIFECIAQNDNNIRAPAENQLLELMKTNLIGFIQTILFILQNPDNFSQQVLFFSLLFARQSFKRATKAKQSNDVTNQYLLIPPDLSNSFLPVIFPLLTNQILSDFTAKLLGQIASYILCFDPENQIISLICQQLPNFNVSIPCCTVIEYIFQEIDISVQSQSIILSAVVPLLSNADSPDEVKSKLITVLNSMITTLPNFLSNPNDLSGFAQSMLSLISVPNLKKSAYLFWDSAVKDIPSIFNYVPNILEISFNDLRNFSNENDENYDSEKVMAILQLWCSLGNCEFEKPGSLSGFLGPTIPVFFPLILSIYQHIQDPNSLDSDSEWYPHTAARDCIRSLSAAFPNQSIPILLNFTQEAMANLNSNESTILIETILFCFSVVIDSYNRDDNEENENNIQMKNISSQCLQLVSQYLTTNNNSSIRVISQALNLLLSIIQSNPELTDFSEFVGFLMNCLQNSNNPLCKDAKNVLSEIVLHTNYSHNSSQIFEKLISFDNVESLDCAQIILKNQKSPDFARHFLPQLIALADIFAKNQSPSSHNEPNVVDTATCQELLPLIIQMIIILVDELGKESIPYLRVLFNLMQSTFEQYELPESLKAICSIVHITNQNVQYAVNLVIIQLNNSISNENSIGIVINNYEMRLTAISSITLYLSKCDISQCFHELMRILLRLLGIQEDGNENNQFLDTNLKIAVLEAINSLHFSFPLLMKPYFNQLITIFGLAINSIEMIREPDDEESEDIALQMNTVALEDIKLLLASGIGDSTPVVLQMALSAIQCAINSPCLSKECMAGILDVLNIMMKLTPNETKQYIASNESLKQLFEEAKEDDDLNAVITNLMASLQ